MAKENKKSLIIWALVALVIGVILGLVITNITTTGNAKEILGERAIENIQEDRIDLRANNLYINKIYRNTENPQNASIGFGSNIKAETGFYWGKYENSTAFTVSPNTGSVDNGNSTITIKAPITIDASIKMIDLTSVSPVVAVYDVGDTISIENKTIEILEVWDMNNVAKMLLSGATVPSVIEYYTEGDIIFNQYLNANLKVEMIDQNSVGIVILPSGDFYVCINSENELYKSNYPCN